MNPRMENARNQFGISIARTMELEQAPETHRRAESAAEWAETSCWCRNYEESRSRRSEQPSGSDQAKMKGRTLVSSALFLPVRVSEMFDDVANGIVVLEGQQRAGRFDPDHVAPGQ